MRAVMTYARFRHLAIERAQQAPTDDDLVAIEAELGAKLPGSFREFLGVAHGGYIEYSIDVTLEGGATDSLSFSDIFRAVGSGSGSILKELAAAREINEVPQGVLPFARDGGDSIVFLDLSRAEQQPVVAFVQGRPAWTGRARDSQFIELAPSFDDYVARLHIDRELLLDQLEQDASEVAHVEASEEWLDIGMPGWRERDEELNAAVLAARKRVGG